MQLTSQSTMNLQDTANIDGSSTSNYNNNDCNRDCASDNSDHIDLFVDEEREYIGIQLTDVLSLRLRQYNSYHDDWGIYSTVWDGGLGLVKYLQEEEFNSDCNNYDFWKNTVLIDLGSGTGIVGIAAAALSQGQCRTYLTDLPEALPLLRENVVLNAGLWRHAGIATAAHVLQCVELSWGNNILVYPWIDEVFNNCITKEDTTTNILITGADIVYRKSLFVPLIETLTNLDVVIREKTRNRYVVDIVLACNSSRTYLDDFWECCRQHDFKVTPTAVVDLNEKSTTTAQIVYTSSFDSYLPEEGRMYVVKLTRQP